LAAPRRRSPHHHRTDGGRIAIGPLLIAVVLLLVVGAGYGAWHRSGHGGDASAAISGGSDDSKGGSSGDGSSSGSSSGGSSGSSSSSSPGGSSAGGAQTDGVPKSGTGKFATAHASGRASGHGTVRRYKVQVEGGISLSPSAAAHEIEAILANPRGWTADGHDAFQLVSSGHSDFVVKIATPDTVDDICGAAGLDTGGEVNCDVGSTVVVNLKRWMLGSPEFNGPISEYRALIINHEVGHRIGHGHEGCPGPGKPAPVMMQQIKGLDGCKANEWPYDAQGHYLSGPPAQ
jgi:hypothetical protein